MRNIRQMQVAVCSLILVASGAYSANDDPNKVQLQFDGEVSVPTCKLNIPEQIVTLPTVKVVDFATLGKGDVLGEKTFSLSVGECSGGPDTITEIRLTFEPKNGIYDNGLPAFPNQAGVIVNTTASGVGAVISDERNGQNVTDNALSPAPVIYETSVYPLGTDYNFTAQYMKTDDIVTSGEFLSEIIITATYG